jgi:hypothetical protein
MWSDEKDFFFFQAALNLLALIFAQHFKGFK